MSRESPVDEAVLDALDALQEAEQALERLRKALQLKGILTTTRVGIEANKATKRHKRMSTAMRPLLKNVQDYVRRREGIKRLGGTVRPLRWNETTVEDLAAVEPLRSASVKRLLGKVL